MSKDNKNIGGGRRFLGKYRGLAVLIVVLVISVLALLALNLFLSDSIEKNGQVVALTDRQGALINQVSKDLFLIESRLKQGLPFEDERQVLGGIVEQFDATLNALDSGGVVSAAGRQVEVPRLADPNSGVLLFEAMTLWGWYKRSIEPVLGEGSENAILDARAISEKYTQRLGFMMDSVATMIRERSVSNIRYLRIAQYIGIVLVLIIFAWTAFVTMRRLLNVDAELDSARGQMKNILDTVDSGLFLLSNEGVIGGQYSGEMERIFATSKIAGRSFSDFMSNMVSAADMDTTRNFLSLIFDRRKKQRLLGDLNPLQQVAVQVSDDGGEAIKYLKFKFQRVENSRGEVENALGNVQDITRQVELQKQLEASESKNAQQMEMLSALINADLRTLKLFLQNSSEIYNDINDALRQESRNRRGYIEKANSIFAMIHGVKGEAGALGIGLIAGECQEFEEKVKRLRNKSDLIGKDFLTLTVSLDQLISYNELMRELLGQFNDAFSGQSGDDVPVQRRDWGNLYSLVDDVASRQGKQVELILSGLNDYELSDKSASLLTTLATQLIRNAIAHGIESERERKALNKRSIGRVWVTLSRYPEGGYSFSCMDNGGGVDVPAVLEKAVERDILTRSQADKLDKQEILKLVFHPSFSSADEVDLDHGQGVGLFTVKQRVSELGGKITISSIKGKGTKLAIQIPKLDLQSGDL